jgi:UDP-GlcNAc:undecaprenyl-phosphate GlcNAc-1-phosphate transferase
MQFESIFQSFISVFGLVSFLITLVVVKLTNKKNSLLLDVDYIKPQAFHHNPTARGGGLAAMISLIIFYLIYFIIFKNLQVDYLIISLSLFSIGFLDDIKKNFSPKIRLSLMIVTLLVSIYYFNIRLINVDLIFLDTWLLNNFFNTLFILLCFLFIINGANLIDGFNGLLAIHLLIINSILLYINTKSGNNDLNLIIIGQVVVIFTFLLFNFPKAKVFLGDGGSYLFGSLTALNIIKTNNFNTSISSFFFCTLLFYLFFEVFFSFFRKIYQKKSPLKPDNEHLHMLTYAYLKKLSIFKDCNYLCSIIVNLVYFVLVFPILYFSDNGPICKYWFFFLLALYLVFYSRLYSFVKK